MGGYGYTKHGFSLPSVVALTVFVFVLGSSEFIVVGILPDIADALGVGITMVGNLVGMFAIVYALATPVIAIATARMAKYRLLMILCAAFATGNIAAAIAPNYEVFALARIVTAAVAGAAFTVAVTFVADIAAPRMRPKIIAVIFAGFSMSSVLGVPLGSVITQVVGWHAAFWALCVVLALTVVLLHSVLPHGCASESDSVVSSQEEGRSGGIAVFLRTQLSLFEDRRILLNAMQLVLSVAGVYTYYTYLNPILVQVVGISETALPLALAAYGAMTILSNLSAGVIVERWGQRALPFVYALLVVLLAALPFATASGVVAGIACCLAIGYATALQNSQVQIMFMDVAERTCPQALNLASSLNPSVYNIGIAAGSFVGGVLVAQTGVYAWLGPVGAILAAAACVFSVALGRVEHRV